MPEGGEGGTTGEQRPTGSELGRVEPTVWMRTRFKYLARTRQQCQQQVWVQCNKEGLLPRTAMTLSIQRSLLVSNLITPSYRFSIHQVPSPT